MTVQHTTHESCCSITAVTAHHIHLNEVIHMAGYSRPAVARIFGVPALGGLLFGWDIGATSYVLTQLQSAEYSWRELERRRRGLVLPAGLVITSGGVAGALIGAAIVFRVADAIGRRRELILAALLYIAGAVLEVASGSGTLKRPVWRSCSSVESSTAPRAALRCMGLPRTSPRCRPRPYEGRSSV